MSKILALVVALVAVVALPSGAQAPTRPALVYMDSFQIANACGTQQEIWNIMAGTCDTPGTTPWIQSLRVRVGTQVVDIPRANVQRLTTAAECGANVPPCLRSAPVTIPGGTVTLAFVTNTGEEGDPSAAIPFSPATVRPSAPRPNSRVVPAP